MDHLLVHKVEVMRRPVVSMEDGTPVHGELAPIEWPNGRTHGACRLDQPRDSTTRIDDTTTVTVQRSTVLTSVRIPVREMDTLRVTTPRGSQLWIVGGITDADGMHGAHHVEINVSREIGK